MTSAAIPAAVACRVGTLGAGPARLSARATEDTLGLGGDARWQVNATVVGASPQAAVARDGELAVLLVGEITDNGGPEAVLRLYRDMGPWVFGELSGRFAAVVVHGPSRRVTLSGDHAGTVPLYVVQTWDGDLEVATEAKVLAPLRGRGRPLPGTNDVPGLRGVRRLRAGTCLTLHASGHAQARPTWVVPAHRERVDPDEAVAQVRAVLDRAVAWQARDRMVTVLSGGIDSSAVAATVKAHLGSVSTMTMGTDRSDEFGPASTVAKHLHAHHTEVSTTIESVLTELPTVVGLTECADPAVNEYLLPLARLYREVPTGARVMTGYGADIPLGGMHRGQADLALEERIVHDMSTFDGLNELSPNLGTHLGLWTSHPYWDRAVLQRLVTLAAGLKRRDGRDKWVLREAFRDALPARTVLRPKLGIHEGSGTTSYWSEVLLAHGVAPSRVPAAKARISRAAYDLVVVGAEAPESVDLDVLTSRAVAREVVGA
jgi:(carboxyethyl)arginine beta-lactam-synthase